MFSRRLTLTFLFILIATGGIAALRAQGTPDYEKPPVSYSATTPHDALTRLQHRLATGAVALVGSEKQMLQTILNELGVSAESQMLVFSRTSLQRGLIRPDRPRALYFSDSVYVGWVPGGLVEVAAIDPQLGPVFYSVALPKTKGGAAQIARDSDCMRCHGGVFVREIPGLFARSLFPDERGDPLLRHGSLVVDDRTPFADRWGGWYVTGYHGAAPHRGNTLASERGERLVFDPSAKRPDVLSEFFETSLYLRPTSDIIALLISEHQMAVQNVLTHAGFSARRMIAYQHGLQKAFREAQTDAPTYDSVKSVFASAAQDVIDALLFREAAPLPTGILGHPDFRKAFTRDVPRSRSGASLKDLQLSDRLFAQRCSYLIYSEAFHALPDTLRFQIIDGLDAALRDHDAAGRYAYLPAEEKQRIRDILLETHPECAARWTNAASR